MFQAFSRYTLGPYVTEFKSFPRSILYPTDFFSSQDETVQEIMGSFTSILENFLGVRRTEFSLADRWTESPPPEAEGKALQEYMNRVASLGVVENMQVAYLAEASYRPGTTLFITTAITNMITSEQIMSISLASASTYHHTCSGNGKNLGAKVTKSEREQSLEELKVFQDWFADNVLRTDEKCGSTAILILPVGPGIPIYRDIYLPPRGREGIDALSLGAFLSIPQIVLPIGQSEYKSRVSDRVEIHPVAGSIAGASGSDRMLIKLVEQALKKAGWPTQVTCGRYAFPLSEDDDGRSGN
ncbi:hypothetical protein NUW58_g7686 [Xylaria curta]|uniref:Uncharacterized protein n=1 Tax=Xylaria curta TaxID=42375 RepID=A0ACC1NFJ2_9PEZI|nr:hypothetical protein NUW58_g7686 [Xylaria curta]